MSNRTDTRAPKPDRRQPAEGVMSVSVIEEWRARILDCNCFYEAQRPGINALCDLALRGLQGPSALMPQDAPEFVLQEFRCKFGCIAPCQSCDATTQNYYRTIRRAILRWEGR